MNPEYELTPDVASGETGGDDETRPTIADSRIQPAIDDSADLISAEIDLNVPRLTWAQRGRDRRQ